MDRHTQTIDTYNKAAVNYQDKFMTLDLYHDTFDEFCRQVNRKNADILELGCGPGNITKYLLNSFPQFKITGLDLAPRMVELARRNNPGADFRIMDCRDIDIIEEKYDAIMCGFCMPYLSKEESVKLIKDASKLLNSKGVLYISTMEGDYHRSGYETTSFSPGDEVYIYYHQSIFIEDSLSEYGFQVIDLQRKDFPEPDGTFQTDMIFLARKIEGKGDY